MLKKFFITCLFLTLLIFVFILINKSSIFNQSTKSFSPMQVKITPAVKEDKKIMKKVNTSIFVPYWSNWDNISELEIYDNLIYFGVAVSENGLDKNDTGYKKIEDFVQQTNQYDKNKWLTLRMTNTEKNLRILENTETQKRIIEEAMDLIKTYRFNGLVLDLEMGTIALDTTVAQINNFVQQIYKTLSSENIRLAITLYGDNYYRKRPFDLSFLTKNSDELMIMAYDLHKSRGEPGPNFPLAGKQKYGYDLQTMLGDFGKYAQKDKLTIIFGMYGYDWIVDEKKRPIKAASSLSLNEINNKIIPNCKKENCVIKRDEMSKETEVNYVDKYNNLHIAWYEDNKSTEEKINYLKEKGIFNYAYWAYGYF